ncbi:MAG: hypothetical protein NTZ27_05265 [Ignavibacteriales bacterium]|nr:hypothetical protein [Ignavibacteriales bacterium]
MNINKHDDWKCQSANYIIGCEHGCLYCYSNELAEKYGWLKNNNWTTEIVRQHALDTNFKKYDKQVMFPTSHDITPNHLDESIQFLRKILEAGNDLLIVSKPHLECIKRICKEFDQNKDKILFRFSIGSVDDNVLKFWEPGAPDFKERFSCLKHASNKGFQTSVSCEPMLDDHIERVVKKVDPYVTETIWIGKINRLLGTTGRGRLEFNGHFNPKTEKKALQLIQWQSDQNIIKLYDQLRTNPKIRWKTSIKSVLQKHSLPV